MVNLIGCENITIQNHEISNICVGIKLLDTYNCLISGNTLSNNELYGIMLMDSSNNTIIGNTISNNRRGIYLDYSCNVTMRGNTLSSNEEGGIFLLDESGNNIITNNSFFNDGLWVSYSYHNNVENNTVNGKPLVYLELDVKT